jgi:hypothetical protein
MSRRRPAQTGPRRSYTVKEEGCASGMGRGRRINWARWARSRTSLSCGTLSTSTLLWIKSQGEGHSIQPEDAERFFPLVFEHITLLGRYAFSVPESVVRDQLRHLRNPTDALRDVAWRLWSLDLQHSCDLKPGFRSIESPPPY